MENPKTFEEAIPRIDAIVFALGHRLRVNGDIRLWDLIRTDSGFIVESTAMIRWGGNGAPPASVSALDAAIDFIARANVLMAGRVKEINKQMVEDRASVDAFNKLLAVVS